MKKIKTNFSKGTAVLLTVVLICCSMGIPAFADNRNEKETETAETEEKESSAATREKTVTLSDQDREQLTKEETVYVIADAGGSTKKLIVSDWLKNAIGSDQLEDVTELTNISNVKGEESFQKGSGPLTVWDAAGNDIYYQGNIQKELPIELKVSYYLNGRQISPEKLAGQSGKVKIRFDYINRQKEKVMIGEKEEELYVPFVVITGIAVENDTFQNIDVSNGRVINDGERSVVMGYAMPGFKDNLETGSEEFDLDEIDIPDYVEITADVTEFELTNTMTIATNSIFGDIDINTKDKMNDISDDMDELTDAMEKLMDGTSELYDGVVELYDGTEEMTDGIDELWDGAGELTDGAHDLKNGAKDLKNGAVTLNDGLLKLKGNNETLKGGAKQVFETLLDTAESSLKAAGVTNVPELTIENYGAVLSQVENGIKLQVQQQVAAAMKAQIKNSILQSSGQGTGATLLPAEITVEETQTETQSSITADASDQKADSDKQEETDKNSVEDTEKDNIATDESSENNGQDEEEQINDSAEKPSTAPAAEKEENMTSSSVSVDTENRMTAPQQTETKTMSTAPAFTEEQINALVEQKFKSQEIQEQYKTLVQQNINEKTASLKALKASLDSYNQFYQGILAYTDGVADASAGAEKLASGSIKLYDGASELYDGTVELYDGTVELKDGGQELKDGVAELRDGSLELDDGVIELNDDGIQKLVDLFDGDLKELSDRFEATKTAALNYKSFAGISDNMEGSVKFIYKTDAIEK